MTSNDDNHDPGWNDPPTFTYDKAEAIKAAAANKKSTPLNKRVAFPMSGNISSDSPGIDPTILPSPDNLSKIGTPPMGKSRPQITTKETKETVDEHSLSKAEQLGSILENFKAVYCIQTEDEVSKRIKVMEKMWLEDKLDSNVQSRVFELSEALIKGDTELADHIHKGLMVDYVSQCSPWMSAVRQIINYKRNNV